MKKMMSYMMLALGMTAVAGYSQTTQGWSFEVTPYAWYAGMEGDIKVGGRSADFEKDASDLLDAAKLGGSMRIGASYDRFVIGALIDYFSLSTDELDVEDQPRRGTVDSDVLLTEVAAGYRVGEPAEGSSYVFAIGVRNLSLENTLSSDLGPSVTDERDITDVMVYILPSVPLFPGSIEGLRFNPVLGIGAGDSDLAYELFPQIQYDVTDSLAIRFGYRRVGWRFEGSKDNEFNTDLAGLAVGLGLKF